MMMKRKVVRKASLGVPDGVAPMATKKTAAVARPASGTADTGTVKSGRVETMPASFSNAANDSGMFLYTNDQWSLRYFNDNDLHSLERKLFGN